MIETSPKSRPGTPPPPLQKETAVGNYFVSNYPPFSFWRPEQVPDLEAVMERPPSPNTPLGLYVHIPFCRKRCHFCYFKVYTDKDSAAIRGYLETLLAELRIYAAKPFIGGRRPQFVYFGGGTPSYLSADQLRTLVQGMRECLPWDQVEEVTFECEPGTLTDHKLEVIRELGVTRLSLGVENFDDHILEVNGRAHHSREIERAYGFARQVGFPQINVDLIAGMLEETEENWRQCIRRTLEMAPDSVTIYEMEIPYNTTIYQRMNAEGKLAAPVADWETKRRWVHEAFNELERAGYSIASAYTAVRDRASTRFLYRDRLWAGADLLSLGVASFGHLGGTHYQNHHDFDPYVQALQTGRLPIYRALTPSADERLIREFILQLKLGRLGFDYFRQKFGVDPATRFAEPLDRLARWGYLEADASEVRVSRDGLLQIDRLLHEFFLPEHRNARYA
jgi:oxygen-independent coproporphyrinogen III oxidase